MKIITLLLGMPFLSFISCKKEGHTAQEIVYLKILDVEEARGIATTTSFHFKLELEKPIGKKASVQYTTIEGSAKANIDFVPVSGTVNLDATQTSALIDVEIKPNNVRQGDQEFSIQLSNPINVALADDKGAGIIKNEGLYLPTDNSGYTTPASYPGYRLVWSDEFNGSALNTADWNYESGGTTGWGNNELQNYTNSAKNLFLSEGNLIIEARKEQSGANAYTSARITTKGKKEFKFGRIDIRAKLPYTKGIWPALWMLGKDIDQVNWPACGEIDIMELIGADPKKVYGTVHWGQQGQGSTNIGGNYLLTAENFSQKFHVFSIEWKEDVLKWYVDDQLFFSATKQNIGALYPFNKEFFFIMNVAVGGNWPGSPDAASVFPQWMFVDYIRVFQ